MSNGAYYGNACYSSAPLPGYDASSNELRSKGNVNQEGDSFYYIVGILRFFHFFKFFSLSYSFFLLYLLFTLRHYRHYCYSKTPRNPALGRRARVRLEDPQEPSNWAKGESVLFEDPEESSIGRRDTIWFQDPEESHLWGERLEPIWKSRQYIGRTYAIVLRLLSSTCFYGKDESGVVPVLTHESTMSQGDYAPFHFFCIDNVLTRFLSAPSVEHRKNR